MDLHTYQPLAIRTAKPMPTFALNLEHAAIGMITEIGEFATPVKRIAVYGKEMTDEMRANMLEELGDTMWYAALASETLGLTLSGVRDAHPEIAPDVDGKGGLLRLTKYLHLAAGTVVFYSMTADSRDLHLVDRRTLAESLAAIVALISEACLLLGSTIEEQMDANITKLMDKQKGRYASGTYSDEAAEARADKGGLDAAVS